MMNKTKVINTRQNKICVPDLKNKLGKWNNILLCHLSLEYYLIRNKIQTTI